MRKNLILKTMITITAGILVLCPVTVRSSVDAFAAEDTEDDFTYSGPLDPDTNEPYREDSEQNTGRERLSDTMYYDRNTKSFVYPINNGLQEVRSSAADGMVTNGPVTIYTASEASIAVHRDGEQLGGRIQSLKDPGEYVVSTQSGSDLTRLFSFIIVGKTTNGLQQFLVPDGFYMTGATLDGAECYYTRYGLEMAAEGDYHLTYICPASDREFSLDVTIDRTAPELTFSGKINDENQVRSALSFTGVEEGGTVTVIRDSAILTARPDTEGVYTLKDSGLYTIRDYDAAGNMTEYQYRVMMYFNISSIIFVLLAAVLVIGIGVYVLIRRHSLRIG